MKKCFITVAIGDKFKEVAKLTTPLMLNYCMTHNYDFFQLHNNYNHTGPAWARHDLRHLLDKYDLVFYSDTDTVFIPGSPDLITLPELDKLDFDVAGTPEPIQSFHLLDLKDYIEKSKLPTLDFRTHQHPYICSGCILLTKGFLKYYESPKLPEIDGIKFRDQNALNYAIRSGKVRAKKFPHGVAGCPYLYHNPEDIKYIWHFNLAMNKNYPHYYRRMITFIRQVNEGRLSQCSSI